MTPDQRHAMLIALAENVMGWKLLAYNDPLPSDWYGGAGAKYAKLSTRPGDIRWISQHDGRQNYWNPMESIADAWMIVDALHRKGMWMKLTSPFNPDDVYNAGFTDHDFTGWNSRPDHKGQGKTAPLAICHAALNAVSGESADLRSGEGGEPA